ncbi:unnamed protein product [Blepharisma stoltei]|uniref:Uncharacterized protein n=1 Tax=Blepharisma stoltei TaxID=1481888 RepID=A0AAU9JQ49_9CILI|nr:unnamed protein product [Blepharisma stoltei]
MSKSNKQGYDPGDRYRNSLSYLTAKNPGIPEAHHVDVSYLTDTIEEDYQEYIHPRLSDEKSQDDNADVDMVKASQEMSAMISILAKLINSESLRKLGTDIINLPPELELADINTKVIYANQLTESVTEYLKTGVFDQRQVLPPIYVNSESEESKLMQEVNISFVQVEHKPKKDILTKLFSMPDRGIFLNQKEQRQLAALLIGSLRDAAAKDIQEQYQELEEKHDKKEEMFKKSFKELSSLENSHEKLIDSNTKLKSEVKKFKQQIGSLEKQLADSRAECEQHAEKGRAIREELIRTRDMIQQLLEKDTGEIDLRLSTARELRKSRSKEATPIQNMGTPIFGNKL